MFYTFLANPYPFTALFASMIAPQKIINLQIFGDLFVVLKNIVVSLR